MGRLAGKVAFAPGPIAKHVNAVRDARGQFAYVTVDGPNEVKVFRTDNLERVATIPVADLPHGVWLSGDGTRVYVYLENAAALAAIDKLSNTVLATSAIGQGQQALVFVPNAVPKSAGDQGLGPQSPVSRVTRLKLARPGAKGDQLPTGVSLFSAVVTAMDPMRQVVRDGGDALRRYLVVAPASLTLPGRPAEMQVE